MIGRRPQWRPSPAVLLATGLVFLFLLLLEGGALPPDGAQRASDSLQLVLGVTASAACLLAGAGDGRARALWSLLGLGCLAWASGQVFWVTRMAPFSPAATYAESDLLFVASTAFFVVAFVMRPDRAHARPLPLAIDLVVLAVALLGLFVQLALAHLLAGDVAAYEVWSTFAFDFRGLALLGAILWALRRAEPPWNRLYLDLSPPFVLQQLGGAIANSSFEPDPLVARIAGPYHAGLYDLPWTLPFVWVAITAARWKSIPREAPAVASRAPGWPQARRATVVAFVSVLALPVAHLLVGAGDAPGSGLARWRAGFALAGTLLVTGLYLVRQHAVLRGGERVLRENEERYRALVDTGTDVVGVYGPDLRARYVSGAVTAVGGYRPDERIGLDALACAHPDDAERVRPALAATARSPGERTRITFRGRGRDGTWLHLEADVVNRLGEPAVRGIVANFREVTERRRAEEERERSLSLLEATLESTADGILVVDRGGRIALASHRFATLWRIPPEVLAARDDERAISFVLDQLQQPGAFLDRVRELYAAPEAESFDTLHFRDGRVFERYSLPQRLAGEVVGRVWSFRDVTGRTRAEQATARLVAIIEATPDFVATCDASLRTLYVNGSGRCMLGLLPDEPLADRPIGGFLSPGAAARFLEEAVPTALREGAWSGESLLRQKDGREVPVLQVVLAHRSPGGEVAFLSTIARDISQRIAAEQELRRSHTMAALGSLVAGVAHEVRNPLFGISSTLDVFEARFAGREDHRPYIHGLREQLGRLTGLMNDLLDYGTPTRLELARGHLEGVVAQAVAACAAPGERARVSVEAHVPPGLPALRMDARRLVTAFRNLLENALQHSPPEGRVRLETRLDHGPGASWVECSIEDDGPGFAPEDLPLAFEPFFSRRHGGTGLGLSIAQRIVADHGGEVAARNRSPRGARITVRLPAAPAGEE